MRRRGGRVRQREQLCCFLYIITIIAALPLMMDQREKVVQNGAGNFPLYSTCSALKADWADFKLVSWKLQDNGKQNSNLKCWHTFLS